MPPRGCIESLPLSPRSEHISLHDQVERANSIVLGTRIRRLVRRSSTGDERTITVAKGEQVEAIEGHLVQVDCLETKARLHIESDKGKMALAIHDPGNIVVRNANDAEGHFELQCGPQKKKIRADYV